MIDVSTRSGSAMIVYECYVDGTQPWPMPVSMGWDWHNSINNKLNPMAVKDILSSIGLEIGQCRPLDFAQFGADFMMTDNMKMTKLLRDALWSFKPGWHWVPKAIDAGAPGESLITIPTKMRRLSHQELISMTSS